MRVLLLRCSSVAKTVKATVTGWLRTSCRRIGSQVPFWPNSYFGGPGSSRKTGWSGASPMKSSSEDSSVTSKNGRTTAPPALRYRLSTGAASSRRHFFNPQPFCASRASELHLAGCPRVPYPRNLTVGRYKPTISVFNERDGCLITSACLAPADRQDIGVASSQSQSRQWLDRRVDQTTRTAEPITPRHRSNPTCSFIARRATGSTLLWAGSNRSLACWSWRLFIRSERLAQQRAAAVPNGPDWRRPDFPVEPPPTALPPLAEVLLRD